MSGTRIFKGLFKGLDLVLRLKIECALSVGVLTKMEAQLSVCVCVRERVRVN